MKCDVWILRGKRREGQKNITVLEKFYTQTKPSRYSDLDGEFFSLLTRDGNSVIWRIPKNYRIESLKVCGGTLVVDHGLEWWSCDSVELKIYSRCPLCHNERMLDIDKAMQALSLNLNQGLFVR